MSEYITRIHALHLRNVVTLLKEVSERYAPNVDGQYQQFLKVREEVEELLVESEAEKKANECADVIIAAVRLGTMLSDDFGKVILDKCAELDAREPLS